MYTAIYARVSTGMQVVEGHSLENQVELCMQKAKELSVLEQSVKVFREEGVSGEDIERPAMNELRKLISVGQVRQIIITHPDRLSRDLTDKLFLCRELEARDVQLIFVDTEYRNTAEGQLFFNLISVIAQYELSLIKKRTVRGRLKAVEKDKKIMPMRVPPFGYDWTNCKLTINDFEAQYVRQIYNWYVSGNMTLREIGMKLFLSGVPPKRSVTKNWSASSIGKILSSEIYIGRYYYNRREMKKIKGERTANGAPKKTYSFRDPTDWIMVEVEPIIPEELFEQARKQRGKNDTRSGNVKYKYLLKSLIRCGHCGRKWNGTTYTGRKDKTTGILMKYRCYRCPNLSPKVYGIVSRCPSNKSIRADRLEEFIWSMIMDALSDPVDYIQRMSNHVKDIIGELCLTADMMRNQLIDKRKELDKLKVMFRRDVINEEELMVESHKLNEEIKLLDAQNQIFEEKINVQRTRKFSQQEQQEAVKRIKEFIEKKGDDLGFDDKRFIVESLIDEIIIKAESEEFSISIIGSLRELVDTKNSVHNNEIPLLLNKTFKSEKMRAI
ncbi:recombinase family protein [Paenibacillus odorifer]|uniref:recombinase family protein n=1 Tax=Paenibacillus odorifer TaxID=189426 RepID=UPI0020C03B3B|nr:recombinase family protein [Paenibacillus odorifer]